MPSLSDVLVSQWHPTLNGSLLPSDFSAGSGRKVWWLGECEHEWDAAILNRSKGQGCPVCSGKRVLAGFNDLATTHPALAAQWHPTKNGVVLPQSVTRGHRSKVWWVCEEGHEWEAQVANRVQGTGCPVCSNKKVLVGFNDLTTTHPDIAAQWHPTKNGDLTPQQVTFGSKTEVWWVCEVGHEWKTSVLHKYQNHCSVCAGRTIIVGVNDFASLHPDIAAQWHPTKNGDLTPQQFTAGNSTPVWWLGPCRHEWKTSIAGRAKGANCPYCSGRYTIPGVTDLTTTHPKLAKQYSASKNTKPVEQISAGSPVPVWWICEKKHEWKTSPYKRAGTTKQECPICSGSQTLKGYNDLATTHPDIAAQWHPTKNGDITPEQVSHGSAFIAVWVCEVGHEWKAYVYTRSRGHGCLKCWEAQIVSKAETELADYVCSLGFDAVLNNRNVLNGKEIDVYIPEKKIGIEFNGVFWHSEAVRPNKAQLQHQEKYLAAKAAGVQLIQIWEDDWNRNPDLVKRVLAHKLGVSTQPVVFARKTRVEVLTTATARGFLEANHIQGFASGSYYLGLRDIETGTLVAVMVLKKEPGHPGTLNITRYATSTRVPGGFTKLLKHAEREYIPTRFITFADHCISDGGLYERSGFLVDKVLPPDYMYVVSNIRKHKFGYRLKKFRDDPTLEYQEGLTEKELATLNGLYRVWDAGKTRYVKVVTALEHLPD